MTTQKPKLAHELLADAVQMMLDAPGQIQLGPENMEQAAAQLDKVAEHLRLSLLNYRAAQKAFEGASFQGIVNGAILKLDEGDTEAAKKFLATLINVISWSPELPLSVIAPVAPTPEPEVALADDRVVKEMEYANAMRNMADHFFDVLKDIAAGGANSDQMQAAAIKALDDARVLAPFRPTHRSLEGIGFRYLDDGWTVDELGRTAIACAFFISAEGTHYATPLANWHTLFQLIEDPADAKG